MCCHCTSTARKRMTGMNGQKLKPNCGHKEQSHQKRNIKHDRIHSNGYVVNNTSNSGKKVKNNIEQPIKMWKPVVSAPQPIVKRPLSVAQPTIATTDVSPLMALMSTSVDLCTSPSRSPPPSGYWAYAGAKFHDPPPPKVLPPPPMTWRESESSDDENSNPFTSGQSPICSFMANELKMLLNVQG